jgi:S-(hydroxymethyl)glutathione dehydrogenase/alcohol dehydrogenase
MRAAVLTEVDRPMEVTEVEIADPRAGEVLVRVHHCGVCRSDLSVIDGAFPLPLPAVLGHEAAGVVEEVGAGVTAVAPGDHVILSPVPSCGHCYFCVRGQPTLCAVHGTALYTATMDDGTSPLSRRGEVVWRGLAAAAFAEYAVMPEDGVVKVDGDIPLETACVIGCAVQTGVGAVLNTAQVEEGATVLVFGAGGIGLSVVQGAVVAGASIVLVADPVAERREAARAFGATHVIDPTTDDVLTASRDLTGVGVDYAFEAAGKAALIEAGLAATRSGGTTVCVGAPPVEEGVSIPGVVGFAATEKRLIGSLLGSCNAHREVPRLLGLWQAGRLDLEAMITDRVALDDIGVAVDRLRSHQGLRTVVNV